MTMKADLFLSMGCAAVVVLAGSPRVSQAIEACYDATTRTCCGAVGQGDGGSGNCVDGNFCNDGRIAGVPIEVDGLKPGNAWQEPYSIPTGNTCTYEDFYCIGSATQCGTNGPLPPAACVDVYGSDECLSGIPE